MSSWLNVNDTTLVEQDFDKLEQPEWVLQLFTVYHVFVVITCLLGKFTWAFLNFLRLRFSCPGQDLPHNISMKLQFASIIIPDLNESPL